MFIPNNPANFYISLVIQAPFIKSRDIPVQLSRPVPCGKKCPTGFTHAFDGIPKCYTVVKKKLNWKDAQANCKKLHPKASLTMIHTPMENQLINYMVKDITGKEVTSVGLFVVFKTLVYIPLKFKRSQIQNIR